METMKAAHKIGRLTNDLDKLESHGFRNNRRVENQKTLISKNRSLPAFSKSQLRNYSRKKDENANLLLTVQQAKIIQK